MRIRFLRSITDAELVAIAAAAGLAVPPSPGMVYQKGAEWHVADDVGLALCTQPQVLTITVDDETEEHDLGVAAESLEDAVVADTAAPDPAPDATPVSEGWPTNDLEG